MCTVTLLARRNGYALGMNRDEKLTRAAGLPPSLRKISGRKILSPSEPGGGTWLSLNDQGVTLALINWYSARAQVELRSVSRGAIVRAAQTAISASAVDAALAGQPLRRINPFRLIGVFPSTKEIIEWRWNLQTLVRRKHRWQTQQWISSGYDEPVAQRIRSATFRRALKQSSAGRVAWLRRLHGSHAPERGPFSTCMHRADAATVSYTEVVVTPRARVMNYTAAAPCQGNAGVVTVIDRKIHRNSARWISQHLRA